jgi:hypothetical protein
MSASVTAKFSFWKKSCQGGKNGNFFVSHSQHAKYIFRKCAHLPFAECYSEFRE